jgi:DNA-binding CsgD family transcriptional regulator/tetratricopeptide (TPR) repeat protein
MHQPAPAGDLIGRDREHAVLRDLLDRVTSEGRLALITGPAGIGKSTLVRETLTLARDRGYAVFVGACYDGITTAPYEPWHDAFTAAPGTDALFTPDLQSYLEATVSEGLEIADERSLARAVLVQLARLTAERPAVLVLEDLHWADLASVELLTRVAQAIPTLPLLLIATWRDAEGASRDFSTPLINLTRSPYSEWLPLQRLESDDIDHWIDRQYELQDGDRQRLSAVISRSADGNPLFIHEIFRELELSRRLRPVNGHWALQDPGAIVVPPLVQQLIAGRLDQLSREVREILEICAVLGQTFPTALLRAVAQVEPQTLTAAITAARDAQMLRPARRSADLQFEHSLTREVLYQGTPETVRSELHRRAADALLTAPEPDADRVSTHLLEAEDERAAEWLLRAGDRAERTHAWTDAIQRFERALSALDWTSNASHTRGWLNYRIACLSRYSDLKTARERVDDALEDALRFDDAVLLAYSRYLSGLIEIFSERRGRGIDELLVAIQLLEGLERSERLRLNATQGIFNPDTLPLPTSRFEAVDDAGVIEGPLLGDLDRRATVATLMAESGRIEAALEMSVQAIGFLESGDDAPQVDRTGHMLQTTAYIHALAGRPADSEADFEQAERAFRDVARTLMVADCIAIRLIVFSWPYQADRRLARRAQIADLQRLGARLGEFEALEASSEHWLIYSHFLEGRWDLALRLAGTPEKPAVTGRHGQHVSAVAAMLHREREEVEIASQWIEWGLPDLWRSNPGDTDFHAAAQTMVIAAELALDDGDERLAENWLSAHQRWMDWSGAVWSGAEADLARARLSRATGDNAGARKKAFEALAAAVEPRQPLVQVAAQRFLAELEIAAGQLDEAAEHLERAANLAESCDVPHERLTCQVVHVQLLAARGDVSGARELAGEVRVSAGELGATRLLTVLDGVQFERSSSLDDLTSRELEVLRSVAEGRTDAEVADHLFIATRTVNAHMRSIRSKLSADTRMRAVQTARERGLL